VVWLIVGMYFGRFSASSMARLIGELFHELFMSMVVPGLNRRIRMAFGKICGSLQLMAHQKFPRFAA
jgi:hypothetical protein